MLFLLTAFSVSIDAYVAGLAFTLGKAPTLKYVASVFAFTFLLSIIALMIGNVLSKYGIVFKIMGALLFIVLGIKNICAYRKEQEKNRNTSAVTVGISVGLDAGIACLSFSFAFMAAVALSVVMAVFHSAFFMLGQSTAKLLKTAKRGMLASGVFLILLGIYKLF